MPALDLAMRSALLAASVLLLGCSSPQGCWPGKEGGCSSISGLVLAVGAVTAGGRGGGEDAPSWRRPLPGPTQRGAFTVVGLEQAQGWSIRRATLATPAQAGGRTCAPGPIHYGSSNELLGCVLAADAVIAGVRVAAGHGFLCRPDERGCVVYAAATAPVLQVGILTLGRGWGVTVAGGRLKDRLGLDPARAFDLTANERAALEAEGLRIGAWQLLRPEIVLDGISGIVAPDERNLDRSQEGRRLTVGFNGMVLVP